jgi:hypothetical protein
MIGPDLIDDAKDICEGPHLKVPRHVKGIDVQIR